VTHAIVGKIDGCAPGGLHLAIDDELRRSTRIGLPVVSSRKL
jgi:hypothetical protein